MKLNPQKTGLTLGAFAGLMHTVWGILVVLGWASALQSWILDLHFLNNPFTIQSFDVVKWITLVVVTAAIGYGFGYVFAAIWNRVQK
ncbi:hypothetical protein HYU94_01100 [Candidatus Daviesbacteria bacterium]|nr:hypothetical protein [Candidatus Daviesbacteria bacterium]